MGSLASFRQPRQSQKLAVARGRIAGGRSPFSTLETHDRGFARVDPHGPLAHNARRPRRAARGLASPSGKRARVGRCLYIGTRDGRHDACIDAEIWQPFCVLRHPRGTIGVHTRLFSELRAGCLRYSKVHQNLFDFFDFEVITQHGYGAGLLPRFVGT